MKNAKRSDWGTKELPLKRITISLNRSFSPDEIQRMRTGVVPEQMEDKWFIYWENNSLFFHRSWTGSCIYVARFTIEGDCQRMVEAEVNRDPEQYGGTSDEHDSKMISYLIDVLLLQQEAAFPSDELSSKKRTLMEWSQVGRAMLGQHPNPE